MLRRSAGWLIALFHAARPRQRVKNLLVFLPLLFDVDLVWFPDDPATLLPGVGVLLTLCVAFCALSSAVYIGNDLADRKADGWHPAKRYRPIASGRLPAWLAVLVLLLLAVGGMYGLYRASGAPAWPGGLIGAAYLLVNAGYSLRLRKAAFVDVMLVAGGYVLRVAAGAGCGRRRASFALALRSYGVWRVVCGDRPPLR